MIKSPFAGWSTELKVAVVSEVRIAPRSMIQVKTSKLDPRLN